MRLRDLSIAQQSKLFQSTHPVWDATGFVTKEKACGQVSIHASRVGCDAFFQFFLQGFTSFNPCIPCGMRPASLRATWCALLFQSMHPVWDATRSAWYCFNVQKFQSMHPVWDATAWKLTVDGQWCSCRFAPTCLSCCYLQVRSFYSNDVNVLKSRLYENRRSAGNFL